jgi:hypothetical protein
MRCPGRTYLDICTVSATLRSNAFLFERFEL